MCTKKAPGRQGYTANANENKVSFFEEVNFLTFGNIQNQTKELWLVNGCILL